MPEFIGPIAIPEVAAAGVFPVPVDFGMVSVEEAKVVVHRFASGDAKAEQRFYLGDGARRFNVRLASLSRTRRQAVLDFFEARRGSYEPFTLHVTQSDGSLAVLTVRFATPELTFEQVAAGFHSAGIELVEEPTATPAYAITATLSRFPSADLQTALTSQVQEIIPLVKIVAGAYTIYVADRRVTVGGTLYQPRLLDWDGITQDLGGAADEASFTLGNADRVFRDLVNAVDLFNAFVSFSLFHVGAGTKLDLWGGYVTDWSYNAGPEFKLVANDGLYELGLPYPVRKISRQDGFVVPNQPVRVGGKKGVPQITATSVINETAYGRPLKDVYVFDTLHPVPVPCEIIAGRDESEFFAALGVVSRGPISSYETGHTLDQQGNHGPGLLGLRRSFGGNPATGSETAINNAPDAGSNSFALDEVGHPLPVNPLDGVAFLQIRRMDEKGIQPANAGQHEMVAWISGGNGGWKWTAPGARTYVASITNPVWIVVNILLRAKGKQNATAFDQEQFFDVASAVAAAAICDHVVTKIIGVGTETQFQFVGILGDQKPLRDWITEILNNCLGYFTFAAGKLKIGIRVNSSVVEAFTAGSMVFNSLTLAAHRPTFNDLTASFADADYKYQQNTVNLPDTDHIARIGEKLSANVNLAGTSTKSQAARIVTVMLREELGGLTENDQLKARRVGFKTTVLAINAEPGMLCSMTHPDMAAGSGEFRVQSWRLNKDYSIDIEGRTTTDNMYDLVIGPKPEDVQPEVEVLPNEQYISEVSNITATVSTQDGATLIDVDYTAPDPLVPAGVNDSYKFAGVQAFIETPTDLYDCGAFLYIGAAGGAGYFTLQPPRAMTKDEQWSLYLVARSKARRNPLHRVADPPHPRETPHVTLAIAKAVAGAPWFPNTEPPAAGDPMLVTSDRLFALLQDYQLASDASYDARVVITGDLPIDQLLPGLLPKLLGASTTADGGFLEAGRTYYVAVSQMSDAGYTAPSNIIAIAIPAGPATAKIDIATVIARQALPGHAVWAGTDRRALCRQFEDPATPLPATLTITGPLLVRTVGMPSSRPQRVVLKAKSIKHAGVAGTQVAEVPANDQIRVAELVGSAEDWVGQWVSIVADQSDGSAPLLDYEITAFDSVTGIITVSPGCVVPGNPDRTVEAGGVVTVNTKPGEHFNDGTNTQVLSGPGSLLEVTAGI
jgi:hypothetical protein